MRSGYRREASVFGAIVLLATILAVVAPGFFGRENLGDLLLANVPVLLVAVGATLVILTGEIDISVGSVFAICGVAAGVAAHLGVPVAAIALVVCAAGALLGAVNGALVAYVGLPSIVVTLATMVAWRDALRWTTQGAWIQDLPATFQWLGLSQSAYPVMASAIAGVLLVVTAWTLGSVAAGRAVYATGSDVDAARLAGFDTKRVKLVVFAIAGALTGLAALLNAVRFNQIPTNAGIGLEMKVIASVIVGGTAIQGGRGSVIGTLLGVVLLAIVGPALVFVGVTAYWERAIQGAIILSAVTVDAWRGRRAYQTRTAIAAQS
jgi:rhamnose transport system permease protein